MGKSDVVFALTGSADQIARFCAWQQAVLNGTNTDADDCDADCIKTIFSMVERVAAGNIPVLWFVADRFQWSAECHDVWKLVARTAQRTGMNGAFSLHHDKHPGVYACFGSAPPMAQVMLRTFRQPHAAHRV